MIRVSDCSKFALDKLLNVSLISLLRCASKENNFDCNHNRDKIHKTPVETMENICKIIIITRDIHIWKAHDKLHNILENRILLKKGDFSCSSP